jgi:1,2-diacylglycerol 3-beta-glucosyltransferase
MILFLDVLIFALVGFCAIYLWLLAVTGVRVRRILTRMNPTTRFAIVIPAHNEEAVIGITVEELLKVDYPHSLFRIFVVADFCSDRTAEIARLKGAVCLERSDGERGGKGSALRWLFEQLLSTGEGGDAIIVFDADTCVDAQFLRLMDARLAQGAQVIQGQHQISNPHAGWFPALTWGMVVIDNRLNNQGRSNLGLSAKHMGDSICFRSDILRRLGWGSGLTEDFEFRLRLLLEGIHISYEPAAIGYGQAAINLKEAQAQRMRWARGVEEASQRYRGQLLQSGLRERDWAKLDGAFGAMLPSYTNLTLSSLVMLLLQAVLHPFTGTGMSYLWAGLAFSWLLYPLFGLFLARAPLWAYPAIFSGPLFMLWRTWLHLRMHLLPQTITWVRTVHRG